MRWACWVSGELRFIEQLIALSRDTSSRGCGTHNKTFCYIFPLVFLLRFIGWNWKIVFLRGPLLIYFFVSVAPRVARCCVASRFSENKRREMTFVSKLEVTIISWKITHRWISHRQLILSENFLFLFFFLQRHKNLRNFLDISLFFFIRLDRRRRHVDFHTKHFLTKF